MQRSHPWLALVGWVGLTFLAPLAGFAARPDAWYRALEKPSWNPPPWIFGPVWTLLYLLMAVAAWLVWKQGGWKNQRVPLTLYLVQLFLNALWTPVFFGAHQPGWAFAVILLLWAAIVTMIAVFSVVRAASGWLLAPYLAWVSFASVLNFTIWRLNS